MTMLVACKIQGEQLGLPTWNSTGEGKSDHILNPSPDPYSFYQTTKYHDT